MTTPPDHGERIGDRERAAAAEGLSADAAAGRLTVEELEERLERANAAVYASDLAALEADLPRRRPAPPAYGGPRPFLALPVALLALGIALTIAVGHPALPLFAGAFLLWRFTRARRHGWA